MTDSVTPDDAPTSAPQCSTADCERTDLIKKAGVCRRCYQLVRIGRDPAKLLRNARNDGKCTRPGCEEKYGSRGLCQKHYDQARRSGQIGTTKPAKPRRTEQETREQRVAFLWANIDKRGLDECWPWRRPLTKGGYGQLRWLAGPISAHRAAYLLAHGEIPDGYDVDHKCHDPAECDLKAECPHRACCNPAHLEAVTRLENLHRSDQTRPGNGTVQRHRKCERGCTCERHRDKKCEPGCTCGRHRSSACKPGCTCKRHISRANGGRTMRPAA